MQIGAYQDWAGQSRTNCSGQGRNTDYVDVSPAASEVNLFKDCLHGRNTTFILPQAHLHNSATWGNCLHRSLQHYGAP